MNTFTKNVSSVPVSYTHLIVFQNAGDTSKETTLTLTVAEPKMTFEKSTDTNNAATWDEGSSMLKIDLDALGDGTCDFTINAPAGVSIASLACPWVKITESKEWDATDTFATCLLYTSRCV